MGSSPIVHPIFQRVRKVGIACALMLLAASGACAAPTIFIASDSTAAKYTGPNPQQGWGEYLGEFFDAQKLRVVNAARGGRSSRTFVTEGHWDKMLAEVRAGDFVIIQFGHNDAGGINEEPAGSTRPLRARGTIQGIADDSQEIDNVVTGKHEKVYTFGWYLRKMVADTREKGATPILLTLTATNNWKDGHIGCQVAYRLWTWQTAVNEKVAFVDLSRIISDRYQHEGVEKVTRQFGSDTTHTNLAGAEANAADVVSGLRALSGLKFDSMLSARGKNIKRDRGPPKTPACHPLESLRIP
ncbi:MAG: rhamnogalacturonan acetylesterase [Pseudomonadota bacterium]